MSPVAPAAERRRRVAVRAVPIVLVAVAAFVIGLLLGGGSGVSEPAQRFAEAWEDQDFELMHAQLSAQSGEEYPVEEFTRLYEEAHATATATAVDTGDVEETEDGVAAFEATVDTLAFETVAGRVDLPVDEEGAIGWAPHLVFPGLDAGETLSRAMRVPERGALLAGDGSPLAEGPPEARTSPLGESALAIAGSVGSPTRKQEDELFARGFPPGTPTGSSGLELALDERLAGQPSGQLIAVGEDGDLANGRMLASGEPVDGKPVRTTIQPEVQQAAVAALGGLYGGVAVLDVKTGDVVAVAGLAFSAPQPPGSTFKVITATAALEEKVVKPTDEFPVEVSNSEIGREIANAHDSPCGGNFVETFAESCNTVFAPLGVRVGAEELVKSAEAFGFNTPPPLLAGEAQEALAPPASTIPDPLETDIEVGESAIGQGQVLATPLQMASVAQAIANKGVREPTSLVQTRELRSDAEPVEVASDETAGLVRDMMIEVVRSGTGVAAQLPTVPVAGKTGTAELGPKAGQVLGPGEEPELEVDAWFTAFAPADKPELAIAVMVVNADGDGGVVAAPIAASVLSSVLEGQG